MKKLAVVYAVITALVIIVATLQEPSFWHDPSQIVVMLTSAAVGYIFTIILCEMLSNSLIFGEDGAAATKFRYALIAIYALAVLAIQLTIYSLISDSLFTWSS